MIDDTRTQGDKTSFKNMFEAIERIKNGYIVSTMYGRYAEAMYLRPQIIFCTNREIFGYLKSLSRDQWYHMKITEDHKLLKLGWTDANFWDSVFDSTASKEPRVEKNERTNGDLFFSDIFDEASNT